jgi:hypothetical protein
MLTLPITKDQLLLLIDQLSQTEKNKVLQYLLINQKTDVALKETPDAEIIAGIQQGMKEALTGQLIPIDKMWEGIDVE